MVQAWTITSLDGVTVLATAFHTPSEGSHPKDNGWAWDAATQKAWRIERMPDVTRERWTGTVWEPDLDALRALRWTEVKLARDGAEIGGCDTPLGRIDTTEASQVKIAGAVQMAMLAQVAGQPFSIGWTMQDNTTVDHDDAAMIGMGLAVGEHVLACHEVSRAKRAQLEAAMDAAAIAAVDPASGWPA
ncbi:DUF4376 domain-containing protein [Sphingomonas sp. BK069]|uniref:DUF4376 domain-containing protein n=1 Tax=Sphingomonas sp. BK069 TaxID=2586979 RepID=UPI00160C0048|nr:DUF4376 domain-containing protein [Sphingomonas sp. BK069]MBB3347313.1 hypothetical protein [Sphingomonas sp. BK069]